MSETNCPECGHRIRVNPNGSYEPIEPKVLLEGYIPVAWEPRSSQRGYVTVRVYSRAFSPRRVRLVEVK